MAIQITYNSLPFPQSLLKTNVLCLAIAQVTNKGVGKKSKTRGMGFCTQNNTESSFEKRFQMGK